jgi:hypothetical protein
LELLNLMLLGLLPERRAMDDARPVRDVLSHSRPDLLVRTMSQSAYRDGGR